MDGILAGALVVSLLALAATAAYAWRVRRDRAAAAERAAQLERRADQLKQELAAAEDRCRQGESARDAFFDLATHELRSPLAAILGYQELLADGAYGRLDDGADEPVDRIGRSAKHLLHLIDGVIELSRLRSGSARPRVAPVDLGVLFSTVTESFRSAAHERGLQTTVSTPSEFPTFHSDQDRLLRALDLLATSAIRHPGNGRLHMEVEADEHTVEVRLHPTDIELREDVDDPAVRFGIRVAVAQGLAGLLGGDLDLRTDEHGHITALRLHVADLPRPDPRPL